MSQSRSLEILRSVVEDVNLRTGIEKRLWRRVRKTDSCWEWTGWKHCQGYGFIRVRMNGYSTMLMTHRVSYMIRNGFTELDILHSCDNPACVRPDHLFAGTHQDNMIDMHRKNRDNHWSKLTMDQVLEMRRRYKPHHKTDSATALAKEFGVSFPCAYHAISGRYWK